MEGIGDFPSVLDSRRYQHKHQWGNLLDVSSVNPTISPKEDAIPISVFDLGKTLENREGGFVFLHLQPLPRPHGVEFGQTQTMLVQIQPVRQFS
jgi:hypothetical protein